ncbi:enoyl-CoA hydratase-related protein [Nocardia sp. NPDC050713]|uniref:enoyl-CoA hydratase/isomerase family protein n=1 Tax=Nocardia sp. NPDC050713 TaxID=3154511 RepID=UPI0033E0958B
MTQNEHLPPLVEDKDGVLSITVSTSRAGSSLSPEAVRDGTVALQELARGERTSGAILLLGSGPNFCAGGNVKVFADAGDRPPRTRKAADDFHDFISALVEARRPIVAAVRGWAAGAGMSLALHADIAIGGTSTRFRPAYRGIGLSPDGGMTWTLPRVVGDARARRIILTDEIIDSDEALALGLLARVVEDDEVHGVARAIAADLAAGPRDALSATRSLLADSATSSLGDHLVAEARSISRLAGLPDGIEGVDAFVAKRAAKFGR